MLKKLKVFWFIWRDLFFCVFLCYLFEEEDLFLLVKVGFWFILVSLFIIWVFGIILIYFLNVREKRFYFRNCFKCKSILCKFYLFVSFKFRKVLI